MKKFNKTYVKRLQKLEAHLRTLRRNQFDFARFVTYYDPNGCGTVACAIGWCPTVFPKSWRMDIVGSYHFPVLINSNRSLIEDYTEEFFGLTWQEVQHLFIPCEQNPSVYGGKSLGYTAQPKSVADNIAAFLKYKENNE